jgi:ADP-heptose:LPS heptosyltransferase
VCRQTIVIAEVIACISLRCTTASLVRWYRRWDNQAPAVNKILSEMDASPEQLVAEFLNEHQLSRTYLRSRISTLAELAASEDPGVAESATRALFASLIERLADSFDPESVSLYNRVFSQVTQIWRADARAKLLDSELTNLGLVSEEAVTARAERLRRVSRLAGPRALAETLRRVLVLSRVTLGADVAITSVILDRIKQLFPAAEIILLGGNKSVELFGGDPRLRFKDIDYLRGGTTAERLLSWVDLLNCVRSITDDLTRGEYLIIDPDTRLTQLGLLPLTENDDRVESPLSSNTGVEDVTELTYPDYVFFPSREYGCGASLSLAELTRAWLDEVFGESAPTDPHVSLSQADIESARKLATALRGAGGRSIVAINFGIGENHLKRVAGEFEVSIVSHMVQEGSAVVFDKGAGAEEAGRADAVLSEAARIERDGRRARVIEIDAHNLMDVLSSEHLEADILVWNGRIGMLAALIGESDLYIGYDSAGQHIAAALGVPCIDVFAGSSSPRMLDRWKPTGKAPVRVVAVDMVSGSANARNVLERVLDHVSQMLVER